MRVEQQPTFVLHARPYRETSLLVECLTRDHGRIGVVARGVRNERARLQRAQLEPFQRLAFDLIMKGELATLRTAEPSGVAQRLTGDAGMAGLYLNELVVRLTGRQDPNPDLFDHYERTLRRMAVGEPLAWTLRRFERDMLEALGYALPLDIDAIDGEPLDPLLTYFYDPESGVLPGRAGDARGIRGADLLALAADQAPDTAGLASLRRMMRQIISFHLGGGELKAWRVLR
ncbi:MAG: DNA repair protein RecO [Luteibacter sp.]|uniref:DNA repair protein RecO n=1 Tax=unclassified Luteibacter TaxID=2620188 RepID=UPI0028087B6C|nr:MULTISPECIES: DNA repair protein RecO [unclassified Luteibacter]MDQ7994731.1 DNA repair protein RecO [Luteibacter sp.]MDQ8050077.1 DNA repair protein RecO [Luteibacter sp.]MDR6641417.1 DNA repair protein RecO (recombination protein O) [Luteibacter sp. 1214]